MQQNEAVVKMSRRSEIVESLRKKILLNEFGPGESVPEESLAAEFSVSRTPVREALIVLEHQGLVANEANRGFRVVSVSIESIRSYFEIARALYPTMFSLFLARADERSVNQIVQDDTGRTEAASSILGHFAFMNTAAQLSRNDFMISTARNAESYHCFVRSSVLNNLPERVVTSACSDLQLHQDNIVDALKHQDADALTESLEQMTEGARVFLISHLL